MGHPVVESSECLPKPGGHHPGLWSKQNYCLHDHFVKHSRDMGICPVPDQNTGHPRPLPLGIPQVWDYRRPVIVWNIQDSHKVFEWRNFLQSPSIDLEGRCRACVSSSLTHCLCFLYAPLGHIYVVGYRPFRSS